eukprot:CAMPEP_0184753644 /NCGR_PEP_ID=MMETSP0315-20130426/44207_1 /TAXON_ID=101924 /ORGANISM="Rhodosorus marinus, Strain UTEX LB 2760" /LENGTH=711 /DNA_ID=CAMNT_0027233029 /DNA_START=314 /DNA_END=2449 /DNA_ORIENTATION=+
MARRILQKAVEISNSKRPGPDIGGDLMDVTDGEAETNDSVETTGKLVTGSESTQVTADAVPVNGTREAFGGDEPMTDRGVTTGPTSLNDMLPYVKTRSSEREKENEKTTPQPTEKKRRRPSAFTRSDGRRSALTERPRTRYTDVGGINSVVEEVRELIELPLLHVELYTHLGVDPPRGVLLHGPPGCGKTLLASAIAGELGVSYLKISAPEIVSGMSGDSERKLRDLFDEARENAPCLLFMDEVDAICSRRDSAIKDMERRIVAQLLTCMDDLSLEKTEGKPVIVLGATNRPDSIDPALRRAGRFDRELEMGAPDEAGRNQILISLSRKLRLAEDLDFVLLSRKTAGYVGADLSALTTMASTVAVRRIGKGFLEVSDSKPSEDRAIWKPTDEEISKLNITMKDFIEALSKVQPSALREGFSTVPDVTWADVGALEELRADLITAVVEPIRNPGRFVALGLTSPAGVLLYGPPGCGKTLLAKAVACESSANFISVKGPELLNKFVGESERSVRRLFQRARASAPCIVFFDELDALAPRRSGEASGGGSDSSSSERVVNQLLTELDGIDGRKQVFVIAATNRPDIIDPAMLRPGRLDKLLYVPLPNARERESILRTVCAKTPLQDDVDLHKIADSPKCEGFSGADLVALNREAATCALTANREIVTGEDFDNALFRVFPSVSRRDAKLYRNLKDRLRANRTRIPANTADTASA